jgi:hypothetical protein
MNLTPWRELKQKATPEEIDAVRREASAEAKRLIGTQAHADANQQNHAERESEAA